MASSKKSTKWNPLVKGSLVDVVAPGFRSADDEVQAGVRMLESWGFKVRLPKDLFGSDVLSSNSDERRFRHLESALSASDSAAVWCLRGGYGSIRLIPSLLKMKRPKVAKPLLGLSDVTTIQIFLSQKWGWPSLQSPLIDRIGRSIAPETARGRAMPVPAQLEELQDIILGRVSTVEHSELKPMNATASKSKIIRAAMTGGNLLTFASANGTAIHPSTAEKIVYFEDIGERGYRVDRWLEQMAQAGILNRKTRGIVFGEFIEGNESDGKTLVPAVLQRFASTWAEKNKVPVFGGVLSGHGPNQRVVPIGTMAKLDLSKRVLSIETGVVIAPPAKKKRS